MGERVMLQMGGLPGCWLGAEEAGGKMNFHMDVRFERFNKVTVTAVSELKVCFLSNTLRFCVQDVFFRVTLLMFRLGMSKSRDCAPGKMNFHMEMLLLNLLFYIVNLKKHFGKIVVRFLCCFLLFLLF